jgi:hypothetical protein
MKTYRQLKEELEFLSEEKHSLHVFDIDDTLMHTTAKIHVKDAKGNVTRTLTNQEFNDHKLPAGHSYDFGEFRNAAKFNQESKPIEAMIKKVKQLSVDPKNHIIFNTARANFDDKHTFLNTFKKHGIDMKRIHVIRAGNLSAGNIPAEKKAIVIHGYVKKHKYPEVHMYDDSKTNLKAFLNLQQHHPKSNFHAHFISGNGSATKIN